MLEIEPCRHFSLVPNTKANFIFFESIAGVIYRNDWDGIEQ
jgi:hypothetical protein